MQPERRPRRACPRRSGGSRWDRLRRRACSPLRVATASGRLALAVAPTGAQWQAALDSFLLALDEGGGTPAEPAPPPAPAPAPPAVPTALAAVVASQSVVLNWAAAPGIATYEVSV